MPNEFRLGTDVAERNLTGLGMLPKVVLGPRASNPIPIKVTDSGFLSNGDVPSNTQNEELGKLRNRRGLVNYYGKL